MATVGDRYQPNGARQMCTSHFNCEMQSDAVQEHDRKICVALSPPAAASTGTLPLARGGAGARLARGAATAAGCRLGLERGEW